MTTPPAGSALAQLSPSASTSLGIPTAFSAILRRAVEATPHAIGGAFADAEGEMVDSYSTMPLHDWAVLTAHYGVVLAQLTAAFGTLHFGGPEYFIAQHESIEVLVYAVDHGYYVLLACTQSVPMSEAHDHPIVHPIVHLRDAARALREEMV